MLYEVITRATEALIKATYPNAAQLILDILSLDYNETIMAAAGTQVEEILEGALKRGDYILIIEGGIPMKKGRITSYNVCYTKLLRIGASTYAPKPQREAHHRYRCGPSAHLHRLGCGEDKRDA